MKIAKVEARKVSVGYIAPWDHDKRFYAKPSEQTNVIVEITAEDGTFGWGEAAHAPGIYGETEDATIGAVDLLKGTLIGQSALEMTKANKALDRVSLAGNIAARAGIDVALHDLCGKLLGVPVYQLLGGRVFDSLPTHQCPPATEELPEYVRRFMSEGYRVFKLKMTGDLDYDASMVGQLVDVADGGVLLSLDANQGWSVSDTLRIAALVEKMPKFNDNVILEQPIHARDFDGLARITRTTRLRVMADDGIRTAEDLLRILSTQAADIVSLKIQRVGGFQRVQQMIAMAEAFHVPYIVDEINETRLANTAVAHMAVASRSTLYTGVASHTHHDRDIVLEGGLTIEDGSVFVTDAPGLGITALAD